VGSETSKHKMKCTNIKALQNKIIQIEPPRVNKNNIGQYMICQQYGDSESYCNKPFICVKYVGSHNNKYLKNVK